MEAISKEVDTMIADDIIEPSKSSWSSTIVMIRKPDSTYRFCLDFRNLNEVTKKRCVPPYRDGIDSFKAPKSQTYNEDRSL